MLIGHRLKRIKMVAAKSRPFEEEALQIIEKKWIEPLSEDLIAISETIIMDVASQTEYLSQKYAVTMHDIQGEKREAKSSLIDMLQMLNAEGADYEGLQEFQTILEGHM